MANGTITFFDPNDPNLGLSSEWVFQDGGSLSKTRDRAAELNKDGDELASAYHNSKATSSFTYIFRQPATAVSVLTFPKVGQVVNGYHIDSWSCAWDNQQLAPKLTVNCHMHMGGTNHTSGSCRTYSPSLTTIAPVTFGCPNAFGSAFSFKENAVVDVRSATYSMSVNHVDELTRAGEQLAGENHDATETLEIELTGSATSDDYETSWGENSTNWGRGNTVVSTTSLSFEHHVAKDAAAAA